MVKLIEILGRPHVGKLLEVSHIDPEDIGGPSAAFKKLVKGMRHESGLTLATLDEFERQVRLRYSTNE
jgi:hypothetical protein